MKKIYINKNNHIKMEITELEEGKCLKSTNLLLATEEVHDGLDAIVRGPALNQPVAFHVIHLA